MTRCHRICLHMIILWQQFTQSSRREKKEKEEKEEVMRRERRRRLRRRKRWTHGPFGCIKGVVRTIYRHIYCI
jgi:hypothetical protein